MKWDIKTSNEVLYLSSVLNLMSFISSFRKIPFNFAMLIITASLKPETCLNTVEMKKGATKKAKCELITYFHNPNI